MKFLAVLATILVVWLWYILMPTLAWGFSGIFILPIIGLALYIIGSIVFKNETPKITLPVIIGFLITVVIIFVITTPILHATAYKNLIYEVETSNFADDVSPIDINKVRIVDEGIAIRIGEKMLNEETALASKATHGKFHIQTVNRELYWVAPVVYKGFFKWLHEDIGTPGYIMVSATNERDAKLVQEVNGKKIHIKYQPQAYFSDNLKRHIYMNGYMTKGLTDFTLEIDDKGYPHWVITIYNNKVGFAGSDATGVIIVNPETGAMKEYSINNAPKWVDRIQPSNFIVTQLDDWGQYQKGWLNSWTSQEGVLTTSEGISLVYGKDGKSYWYTGIKSSGQETGTVGFVLVNTRTKKAHFYKQAGATEKQAMHSAEGAVKNYGYHATFPVLYNVSGIATYIMTLKDDAGLPKMYAMVSVHDHTIVGTGKDVKSALRAYKSDLSSKGNVVSIDSLVNSVKAMTVVTRFARDVRNGKTLYYMQARDYPSKIFIADSTISEEVIITKEGDVIQIAWEEGGSGFVNLNYFKNLSLYLDKKPEQIKKENQYQKLQEKKVEKNTDKKWENLSPQQKARLLELAK